jgi:hypothetical protein
MLISKRVQTFRNEVKRWDVYRDTCRRAGVRFRTGGGTASEEGTLGNAHCRLAPGFVEVQGGEELGAGEALSACPLGKSSLL